MVLIWQNKDWEIVETGGSLCILPKFEICYGIPEQMLSDFNWINDAIKNEFNLKTIIPAIFKLSEISGRKLFKEYCGINFEKIAA